MAQYKCVPAPKELIIDKKGNYELAVRSFADLINIEKQWMVGNFTQWKRLR